METSALLRSPPPDNEQLAALTQRAVQAVFGRTPRWRYYGPTLGRVKSGDRLYCYTTEPALNDRGCMRFASWVYRVQRERVVLASRIVHHKLRRSAKARAYRLHSAHGRVRQN